MTADCPQCDGVGWITIQPTGRKASRDKLCPTCLGHLLPDEGQRPAPEGAA